MTVYQSDGLKNIPETERWNLLVNNLPHFNNQWARGHLITYDGEWRTHREFFASVERFLAPGGTIVLQENNRCSTPGTFQKIIEAAGLTIVFAYNAVPRRTRLNRLYYLGIARRGDKLPPWVKKAAGPNKHGVPPSRTAMKRAD